MNNIAEVAVAKANVPLHESIELCVIARGKGVVGVKVAREGCVKAGAASIQANIVRENDEQTGLVALAAEQSNFVMHNVHVHAFGNRVSALDHVGALV